MFILGSPLRGKMHRYSKKRILEITQLFGENRVSFYKTLGMIGHNGIDYRVKHIRARAKNGKTDKSIAYAPVFATHDGVITSDKDAQSDSKGRYINIETLTEIDGKDCKVKTVYFHLANCKHKKGTEVRRGMLIGYGGNTGRYTTGAHLHFGMYIYWKTDKGYQVNYENGYHGAVNPLPYFRDRTPQVYGWFNPIYYCSGKRISKDEYKKILYS
jgi:murein DD-endopeptidase MepM/ murein hydrolase activator NlpD